MKARKAEGYNPIGCASWFKKAFEGVHGGDPTKACELACTMIDFQQEMGFKNRMEAGEIYIEALKDISVRALLGSTLMWGAWCGFMLSRSNIDRQIHLINQKLDWIIQEIKNANS